MPLPKVHVIVLGGAIIMIPDFTGGIVPSLSGEDLLEQVPGLASIAEIDVATSTLVPGASLTIAAIGRVASRISELSVMDVAGVVIVQSADTIDETSFLLDLWCDGAIPVVMTGAMRGATALGADGPANLLAAVTLAASSTAWGLGVLIVMNDEVHSARFVVQLAQRQTAWDFRRR